MNVELLEPEASNRDRVKIDERAEETELSVERYAPERKAEWDLFLLGAKNSTFLFHRDYMDYHRDRFADHSLVVRAADGVVQAVLPANVNSQGDLVSHDGLTYGGLAVPKVATLLEMAACLRAMLRHLSETGIERLFYKQMPSFYNVLPDDEVSYLMFLLDAQLYRRDCALVVPLRERLPVQKRRKRQFNRARNAKVTADEVTEFAPFWERVLIPRLASRYGVAPVHNVGEISLLAAKFPGHIRQFCAYWKGEVVAGTTIYETPQVAHAQYIAATDEGRRIGALDYLFNWLLTERYQQKRYFDFGICNENGGRTVNRGLLDWKEGFGGRCYAHDFYEIQTSSHVKLDSILE